MLAPRLSWWLQFLQSCTAIVVSAQDSATTNDRNRQSHECRTGLVPAELSPFLCLPALYSITTTMINLVRPLTFTFTHPMVVVALLLILLTCWSLWGWCVGEFHNIHWIRHWFGGLFVIMIVVMSAGSGFLVARVMERSSARRNTFEVLQLIADRIDTGDHQLVTRKIRALDHRGDPDQDAYDLLDELPQLVAELRGEFSQVRTTAKDTAPVRY